MFFNKLSYTVLIIVFGNLVFYGKCENKTIRKTIYCKRMYKIEYKMIGKHVDKRQYLAVKHHLQQTKTTNLYSYNKTSQHTDEQINNMYMFDGCVLFFCVKFQQNVNLDILNTQNNMYFNHAVILLYSGSTKRNMMLFNEDSEYFFNISSDKCTSLKDLVKLYIQP